jgi:transposase
MISLAIVDASWLSSTIGRYVGSSSRNSGGRSVGELALIQRVSHRRIERIWQAYKHTDAIPTLKTPSRRKGPPVRLQDAALVLKTYDELKVNALTLERVLTTTYGVKLPHNKIHTILKEAGRALPEPSKQTQMGPLRADV